jgi:hypothetical protein
MLWSHLVSDDSLEELHEFAGSMGIPARGFDHDHYDVPAHKYEEAVAAGAEPVSIRQLVERLRDSGLRVSQRERRESESYQLSSKPATLRTTLPLAMSMNTVEIEVDCGSTA